MSRLLKFLGFIIKWGGSFTVVYVNHVIKIGEQYDIDLLGLLIVFGLIIYFIKSIDKKIKIFEIQDKHKYVILGWNNGKGILLLAMFTWIVYTIEDDLPKIQWSMVLITSCFIIGFVLTLLGTMKKGTR